MKDINEFVNNHSGTCVKLDLLDCDLRRMLAVTEKVYLGFGKEVASLELDKLNRHGIIAGATGTGKTITLKVLAEQLSDAGIPVFLSDIKGDLASLAEANTNDNLQGRLEATQYTTFEPKQYPVEIWDVLGDEGLPVRITISEMGPILLARLLGLNDTQTGILNIVFAVADEQGLLLIDLMDFRAMLNYVAENAKELASHYGTISKASIGVILRSIVVLEQQGGARFFNEPSLEINDFLRQAQDGRGVINILNAKQLYTLPTLYATVLLALLSELYEELPEVGDLDKPKLVFFFDEAHSLFEGTPKALLDQIELIVRLIRSKGVGVFFVTQNPTDIPDTVASQLGNRIQHGLRAFTPKELTVVKAVAQTFRQEVDMDLEKVIQELKVGEAVVSTLQADGTPSFADRVMIYPPQSKIGTIDPTVLLSLINHSTLLVKYQETINRTSAHEQLNELVAEQEAALIAEAEAAEHEAVAAKQAAEAERLTQEHEKAEAKQEAALAKELERQRKEAEKEFERAQKAAEKARTKTSTRRTDSPMDRFTKNIMSSVGREVGKALTRGITGMFKR